MKATQNFTSLFALALLCSGVSAQERKTVIKPGESSGNLSLKLEIERAIDKGVVFLKSQQDRETGAWSNPELPAFSALAVSAMMGDPSRDPREPLAAEIEKGYQFIVSNAKNDGGIYGKGLATYNTSLSMMALVQSGKKEHLPLIAKARRLLINQQQDYDKRGEQDNLFDGGIGYGGSYAHSDLSNTHFAMEALYYSKQVLTDTEFDESSEFDLDWDAAIDFVSMCQNTEATTKKHGDWATVRKEDEGGFVYFPGDTKSEEFEIKGDDGEKRTALRSYGSMSYAGLLAFIYAEMDREDPRIQSVLTWLQNNFTLDENPGMDAQGLYYYYHTMAKALSIAGIKQIKTPDGKVIHWKSDLAVKVMSTQQPNGSWINQGSNRWMEDDPILVTSYSLLALEHVYRNL